jgi:hypothetical protein
MIFSTKVKRIWLAQHVTDFRRQHDGCLAEFYKLGLDPFKGDLVIFIGRRRTKLRVVYADSTGLWLAGKRFTVEAIKTSFRFLNDPHCNEITEAELALILEGTAYHITKRVKNYP